MGDAAARRTATMTRLALGANRSHIVRRRLVEVGVIAAVGSLVGMFVGRSGIWLLHAIASDTFAALRLATFDGVVVGAALLMAGVAAVLAGVPTALQEASFGTVGLAGTVSKAFGGVSERRWRDGLLAAQAALAVVLLVDAALFGRNVRELLSRPTGFRSDGVTVAELSSRRPSTGRRCSARSIRASSSKR